MSVGWRPNRPITGPTNGITARLTTPKAAITKPMSPALAPYPWASSLGSSRKVE